jgi:hypothetical protein
MDLTEGSETSAKLNLTPGKYPKENIQNSHYLSPLGSVVLNSLSHVQVANKKLSM